MRYKIEPGLYALGRPDDRSPVLVTANYKMSFDRLREALPGRNAWILVLDTKGINVWCAAGKGTFGTEELAARVHSSGLAQVVSHRELILPQLAGPGVAAHQVQKLSGFKVIYGPIRAKDLGAFLDAGPEGHAGDAAQDLHRLGTGRPGPRGVSGDHEIRRLHPAPFFLLGWTGRSGGLLDERMESWPFRRAGPSLGYSGGGGFNPGPSSFSARTGFLVERVLPGGRCRGYPPDDSGGSFLHPGRTPGNLGLVIHGPGRFGLFGHELYRLLDLYFSVGGQEKRCALPCRWKLAPALWVSFSGSAPAFWPEGV